MLVMRNLCEGNMYISIYIVVIRLLECSYLSAEVELLEMEDEVHL
jgi:hypothetical protein